MVTVNRELFYSIYERDSEEFVGYLGFTEDETAWEPEIYIIENYRGKGYGTEALKCAIAGLLSGLLVIDKEGNKEKVITECVKSTIRAENIVSQKMMEKIGLKRNTAIACCFKLLMNLEDKGDSSFFEIVEYLMTKKDFFNI